MPRHLIFLHRRVSYKRMQTKFVRPAALASLLLAWPLWAQRAFEAEFDGDKPVKLEGKVVNPHTWITLDVKAAGGATQRGMVEGGSPSIMIRRGFSKASLAGGTDIIVAGFHARNGHNRASRRSVTFPGGSRLFTGGSADGQQKGR